MSTENTIKQADGIRILQISSLQNYSQGFTIRKGFIARLYYRYLEPFTLEYVTNLVLRNLRPNCIPVPLHNCYGRYSKIREESSAKRKEKLSQG